MATYSPPPGYSVGLRFKGDYSPPHGYKVGLRFGSGDFVPADDSYIAPSGIASLAMGAVVVDFRQKRLGPVGIAPPGLGRPKVETLDNYLLPAGLLAIGWGRPAIRNTTLQARPVGIAPGAVGRPGVYNFDRYLRPVGLNAFAGFGAHWVSLSVRRITAGLGEQARWGLPVLSGGVRILDLAGRGIPSMAIGRPTAWFRERQIFPLWFVATRYGTGYVGHHVEVNALGWDSLAFGQAEVHVPRLIVDLAGLGIASPGIGAAQVGNWIQNIRPPGWRGVGVSEVDRFGRGEVYNKLTIIQQLGEVTPSDGGVFGRFTAIFNQKRMVLAEGYAATRYGTPVVRNNARLVRTPAQQDHTRWGQTLVAPGIRYLGMVGTDMAQWGSRVGMIVYNDARVLQPAGWQSGAAGVPDPIWSNQQTLRVPSIEPGEAGRGMVAYAVRQIVQYRFPDPPQFAAGTVVDFLNRPVGPEGYVATRFGLADLYVRVNRVRAWPVMPPANQFGINRVWNVTPELKQMGAVATLWGWPAVRNQWERHHFQGFDAQIFGRAVVKDRRITLAPLGIAPRPISLLHQIRNILPDPPGPQGIDVEGFNSAEIGRARLKANSIFPAGYVNTRYGNATVKLHGIAPTSIPPPYDETGTQFGTPGLNRTQWIKPEGLEPPPPPLQDVGPRYVWAPRGYPYETGHWGEEGHIMDFYTLLNINGQPTQARPVFGLCRVTHRHRTVAPHGINRSDVGEPWVSLNPQRVRHEGSRFVRFGFPKLNAGGTLQCYGFDMATYGLATVIEADYRPRTLRPAGMLATRFGANEVQNLHREVQAKGWLSFQMSAPRPPAWPRASHWISNAYPPFPAQGSDMAQYGTAWVSHYVRTIQTQGADTAIVAQSTPGQFALRMRVSKSGRLAAIGADHGQVGLPAVGLALREIRPRPIMQQQFPRPAMSGRAWIEPHGWDAQQFGDIDRWEAGAIKAHGDDMAAYGRAILRRLVGPAGWAGDIGEPRVVRVVDVAGIQQGDTGKPAAIARWCGDKAVAAVGHHAGSMGKPSITTA